MFVCTVRYVCTCVCEGGRETAVWDQVLSFGFDLLFVQPFLVHVYQGSAVRIE